MWEDFAGSHEKLIGETVKHVKGAMILTEADVEHVRQKTVEKLTPIVNDMSQYFSDYRQLVTSHLSAIMSFELKKVIDARLKELGLPTGEKMLEPIGPRSKFEALESNIKAHINEKQNELETKLEKRFVLKPEEQKIAEKAPLVKE